MIINLKNLCIALVFAILAPLSALAANIYISPSVDTSERYVYDGIWYAEEDDNGCQIYIKGIIEDGDFKKIKSIYDQGITYDPSGGELSESGPIICLDSPGGSLVEAIKIATLIKDSSNTILLPNAHCESACSIIFMAGSINGTARRAIYSSSKLGFHAPELKLEGSNYSAQNVSKAYDLAIMTTSEIVKLQFLPMYALEMLTSTPHSSMRYIETVDDLLKTKINLLQKSDPTSSEYSIFRELPALSAEQLIANICEHSYRMQNNSFTVFEGYEAISVTNSKIKGTVFIRGDHEDFTFPCKVSISASSRYCGSKICFDGSNVDIGVENNKWFQNVLPFWNGQTNLSDMNRQAMSNSQYVDLVTKHRKKSTFSCALSNRSAKITNVQHFTNLRRQAGLNGPVISQVPINATVSIANPGTFLRYDRCAAACNGNDQNAIKQCIDKNDVWIEVQYNGRRGFLSRKFLE